MVTEDGQNCLIPFTRSFLVLHSFVNDTSFNISTRFISGLDVGVHGQFMLLAIINSSASYSSDLVEIDNHFHEISELRMAITVP